MYSIGTYHDTGTPLLDQRNKTIPIAKMLATKPLRGEIQSRQGHGKNKVSYLSTDSVSRTLNDIFGFDGWTSEVHEIKQVLIEKTAKGQFLVVYQAKVRCIHRASGAYKEDVGVADNISGQIQNAISNAIKAAVSDGLKRAARHFGDKLGNILYNEKFKAASAPLTLQEALDQYDVERAQTKFGFEKDRKLNDDLPESLSNAQLSLNPTTALSKAAPMAFHDPAAFNIPAKNLAVLNSSAIPNDATIGLNPNIITSNGMQQDSKGISRFQNKTLHSSNPQNIYQKDASVSVEQGMKPLSVPPSFANRCRPEVLNDISESLNTTVHDDSTTGILYAATTNTASNSNMQDSQNNLHSTHMNLYSKRKLDLSNDASFPSKLTAVNPYSKR